jgi:hypothetical protein
MLSPAATEMAPNETPYAPVATPTAIPSRTMVLRSLGSSRGGGGGAAVTG